MSRLLEGRQEPWIGEPAEEVRSFDESDFKGFEILQDSRIFDLRSWKPVKPAESDPSSLVFGYRRLKVFKQPEKAGNNLFHVYLAWDQSQNGSPVPNAATSAKVEHESRGGRDRRSERISLARKL